MSKAPPRARQSYRHEALMWSDAREFTSVLVPFIEEGLSAGEPVMVAMIREHANWLRGALGAAARKVKFVDMAVLGRNPARIIPAWQSFLDDHSADGKPVRGIGEPIWAGRRPEEVLECQLHEALLNVAVDPKTPFWLICPYDVRGLDAEVIEEAHRSHLTVVEGSNPRGHPLYGGRTHVEAMFEAELAPLAGDPGESIFTRENVGEHVRNRHPGRLCGRARVRQDLRPREHRTTVGRGQPESWRDTGHGPDLALAPSAGLRHL